MKATFKNVAIALTLLAVTMAVLFAVDNANGIATAASGTSLKVCVVDLNNNPVHNATVTVMQKAFFTDNNGNSPTMQLDALANCYDNAITHWGTTTVRVEAPGFVPAVVFNCVVYQGETRKLTVKIYPKDGSNLPYVCYVEPPPDDYVNQLLK